MADIPSSVTEQEDARAWLAMDWLVRTYTPAWLRLARAAAGAAAAWDAARAAAEVAARDAAWDAAWVALAPTVATLQASAHQIVERMLAVTEVSA